MKERQSENTAWQVASDPSAGEKHWMAACILLEGKLQPARQKRNLFLQVAVGLPWSLCISALSALGAVLLFGLALGGVNLWLVGSPVEEFMKGPQSFVLLNAMTFGFASVFMYQKQVWNGGRVWLAVYYCVVAFVTYLTATSGLAYGILDSTLLSAVCAILFASLSVLAAKLSSQSIARLEGSVGAKRLMPHTRAILTISGAMMLPYLICPGMQVERTTLPLIVFVWMCLLASCSGAYVTIVNDTHNSESASTLALATWSPLILSALLQFPVMLTASVLGAFSLIPQVSFSSYVIGAITLVGITSLPIVSALAAARGLRRSSERRLHQFPPELLIEQPADIISSSFEIDSAKSC